MEVADGESCRCNEQICDMESRICHMEHLLEHVLGQLEAEERRSAADTTSTAPKASDSSAVETVVLGQPGMAPPVPLHISAKCGNTVALVRALVRGADLNTLDQSGDTALHCAVRSGNALAVELLVASGASLDELDARGATPLALAVCRGHGSIVEVLLKRGAQMELSDKEGRTPLMHAVALRNTEMVSMLVKHGASVNVVDRNGDSPLVTASRNCLMDILVLLVDHTGPFMAQMVQAMSVAGSSAVFMLLMRAAPIAAMCSLKLSLLARVAREGWFRPVKAMLTNCAERRCQSEIHMKNVQHSINVAKTEDILLELWKSAPGPTRGVAMRRAALMGWDSALEPILMHWKRFKGIVNRSSEIYEALQVSVTGKATWWLLQAHPKIMCTSVGHELMWRAAEHGWTHVLRLLISSGAPMVPRSVRNEGSSPLHRAATRGHEECVRLLAKGGAPVLARDDDGWTPLHCAAEGGHAKVVEILLQYGANPKAKDPCGLTPCDVATTTHIASLLRNEK